ncbi:MAG TPA: NAD-dependent DNA ligase LigA [Candidatus Poseidoniales archaeon]|nr:MAG TPA: NAD-dependent DNA ligase LigA [Candidatus Poseidoniales archaeon]HII58178.1 NAD-dependent DNA ligase LigA [Candidatus Poseidoniaceae archaeon]|tara:strand:- start:4706 stop:6841 length:2136 start_codon:yes stop_codon:yes gene_type:complete
MADKQRIEELSAAVRYHRELYYNHSAPEISDADFDKLWDELKLLDPNNSVLHEVGPEPLPGTEKVEHMFPMRSLDKGTTDEDITHFVTQSTFGGKRYLAQPKLDGSALSLEYVAGNLHRAATRGSGEKGEDVTLNAKLVANIPLRLNVAADCHVRGEVVMPLATFEQKYRDVSPNPRNLCSGALRQKHGDGKADAADLVFCAYDVKFVNEPPTANHDSELLAWLQKAGIEPAPWTIFESDSPQKAMIKHTREWSTKRSDFEFEIDGIVFKLDNLQQRENLGMTAHHPRWALAWKFPPEEATSVLLSVDWQTGRTGNVTPVARIAPQSVGGVTVENTTLHNPGEVARLGVKIGDKILIVRRGDVIPKIEHSLGRAKQEDLADRYHADGTQFQHALPEECEITIPQICPSCDSTLIVEGAFLKCYNMLCEARTSRSILYWCRALEMDGIGEKLVEQLLEADMISSISGLYELTSQGLTRLERMGEKSAQNVLSELARTKKMPLGRFIHALGLPGIGPELASLFASHVKTLEGMLDWLSRAHAKLGDDDYGPELDESGKPHKSNIAIRGLCEHDGIGEKVAIQVRDGLELRRVLIHELSSHLVLDEEPVTVSSGKFDGMTFCITGTLTQPRKVIQLMVKAAGGKVVGSISAKLDVLIAGENAGTKLTKAESLGLTVWDEDSLNQALKDSTQSRELSDAPQTSSPKQPQRSLLDF